MKRIAFILFSIVIFSQVQAQSLYKRPINNKNEWAWSQGGLLVDGPMALPADTTADLNKWGRTKPLMAVVNDVVYIYSPSQGKYIPANVTAGGGSDSTGGNLPNGTGSNQYLFWNGITSIYKQIQMNEVIGVSTFPVSSFLNDVGYPTLVQVKQNIHDSLTDKPVYVVNLGDATDGDSTGAVRNDSLFLKRFQFNDGENTTANVTVTDKAIQVSYDADVTGLIQKGGVSIASPTSSENVALFYTPAEITVSEIHESVVGSSNPAVTYTVYYGDTRDVADGTIVLSRTTGVAAQTGASVTPNASVIPAGSYIWLQTSAIAGTVKDFSVTINYHQ